MNVKDFNWMHRGRFIRPLNRSEQSLLDSIDISSHNKNKAVLLLHGFSSSPAVYRLWMPFLKAKYDGIFIPNLAGHGTDYQDFSKIKADDWLNQAESIGKQLSAEFNQLDVVGLSLGGLLAYHLSQCCNINKLFLLAPAFYLRYRLERWESLLTLLPFFGMQSLKNCAGNLHNSSYDELVYAKLPLSAVQAVLKLISNYPYQAPKCPTKIFLGQHDRVVNNNQIAKKFGSFSQVVLHKLPHSAHIIPLDQDWKTVLNLLS